ncbi:AMP-binding protein [Catenuloplanes indicus]|uniref:Amino acid adenylation domain-containing protein n=1 Tax=Catenuloplanes indicus TaxID=137267 RepID=A0AAE4AYC9_9ACTN|nr:AMP-binding protein [Catenuloplanes indicus]MDQ0364908.1 amino acid adenylation domain-containing protein [Catenuloplanes indicus]
MTTTVPPPVHAPGETMPDFLLAAAGTTPARPAVIEFAGNGELRTTSYGELAARVRDTTAALADAGLGPGDRVLLETDTSAAAIGTFLACGRLGVAFVPVSPQTPDVRLATIAASTEPALYLSAGEPRQFLAGAGGVGTLAPEGLRLRRRPARRVRHRREVVAADTAYMIFTSGTTGRPKGVVMSHRAVVAFYHGMLTQGLVGPADRVASTSPFQFDFSLLDIGLALGSGASVVPVPRDLLRWPSRFLTVLRETGTTQVNGVPSIWRQVLRHSWNGLAALHGLRGVLFCGERFPMPELRRLQAALPQARIVNCYGATESMACAFADVPRPLPDDLDQPPIGRAHPGAELLLIGPDGAPVTGPGANGEMYLRSPALFTGYWDDPEATRSALVPDPTDPRSNQVVLRTGDLGCLGPDGELYFSGRADGQVQIRGNRVELAEVERRLLDLPGVAAAAAVVIPQADGDVELAAMIVQAPDAGPFDPTEAAAFCRTALPAYMVPGRIWVVDGLPVTENGKLDRVALSAWATEAGPTIPSQRKV